MKTQRSLLINIAIAITIAIAIYAIYVIGMAVTSSNSTSILSPILQGCLIILTAFILLIGFRQPKLYVAWIGWIGLTLASIVFLFGVGALLLPVSGLLLILLVILTVYR
jgi:hypothetical protein